MNTDLSLKSDKLMGISFCTPRNAFVLLYCLYLCCTWLVYECDPTARDASRCFFKASSSVPNINDSTVDVVQ